MAETISVTCSDCTGACLNTCSNICRSSCEGLCVNSAVSGVFGKDDDAVANIGAENKGNVIVGDKPSGCKTCTGTCIDMCGNDCEGKCSSACTGECTGDCLGTCTLGCKDSCFDTCDGHCGDTCETGCKLDCTDSCMGVCEGCTGCSNTCKNECENQCIFSCAGKATSSENGGMLDFSNATMEEILRTLKWKKISEFPLSPTVLNDDQFVVVDDTTQPEALDKLSVLMSENPNTNSANPLENMDMVISDYSLKTVRVTAAEFVNYLSTHIKNFVLWYPVYNSETHELSWIRRQERPTNNDAPPPIDLLGMVADVNIATPENKGLMSAEDKRNLDKLVATDFATQEELDTYKEEVSEKFTETVEDFDNKLTGYVTKVALTDQYYTKGNIDTLLLDKSNTDHLHDDRYLKLDQYNEEIEVVNNDLDKAYNAVDLTNTTYTGKQTISGESFPQSSSADHVVTTNTFTFTSRDGSTASIDVPYEYYKYRMATATYGGLLSNTDYVAIHRIPDDLTEVRNDVPSIVKEKVKVGDLANDIGYLTASTLPIATDTVLGGVKVDTNSRISVDTSGFINTKDFGASNMIKNSTFALGDEYWNKSDSSVTIISYDTTGNAKSGKLTLPLNGAILQTVSTIHGKYLTLSFDMMGTAALVITIQTPTSSIAIEEALSGASWFHFSKVIELDDASLINTEDVTLKISNSGTGASDVTFYLKNIMLQNGMYDTGWVPNPYDGNAVLGFKMPYTVDNKTIVLNNGVISSPSEIDDSPLTESSAFSDTTAFSTNGVKAYIPKYVGNNPLSMTKTLRFTELYNSSLGYGLIIERTSTAFMMRATEINKALSDDMRQKEVTIVDEEGNETTQMVDDIPLRIDLQNNTCNINGSARSSATSQYADFAKYDLMGRSIHETYVTVEEFNAVLEQLKTAIDALNA